MFQKISLSANDTKENKNKIFVPFKTNKNNYDLIGYLSTIFLKIIN